MKEYCKFKEGNTLFLLGDSGDYWVNPTFNSSWQDVDPEEGPHPCADFGKLSEEEALKYALSIGMTKESFYKCK